MVDGAEFRISCKRPAFLSSFSRLQVIPNLAPSTIVWRQCDIQMSRKLITYSFRKWQLCTGLTIDKKLITKIGVLEAKKAKSDRISSLL